MHENNTPEPRDGQGQMTELAVKMAVKDLKDDGYALVNKSLRLAKELGHTNKYSGNVLAAMEVFFTGSELLASALEGGG